MFDLIASMEPFERFLFFITVMVAGTTVLWLMFIAFFDVVKWFKRLRTKITMNEEK